MLKMVAKELLNTAEAPNNKEPAEVIRILSVPAAADEPTVGTPAVPLGVV